MSEQGARPAATAGVMTAAAVVYALAAIYLPMLTMLMGMFWPVFIALVTVRELKQQEGLAIYLCGGGNLAGELLPEIDRLILKRNPVVLGDGVRLFGNAGAVVQNFDLVSCRSFESGVVIEEYARTIRQ